MTSDRRPQVTLAVSFLVLITVPSLIQAALEIHQGRSPRVLDLFQTTPTAANLHAYEHELEKASFLVQACQPWMRGLEWQYLDDAGEKVVVGREDWLFYAEGVRYVAERPLRAGEPDYADPLPAILAFRDDLQAWGIRLVVVPVPDKASVYPDQLAAARGSAILVCDSTRRLLDALRREGIATVDLFEVFREARRKLEGSPERLYLRHDTHWSPHGAKVAANATAATLLERQLIQPGQQAYEDRTTVVSRLGDLVEMLDTPRIANSLGREWLTCDRVVARDTGLPYQDSVDSEVLLIGDSFLRIYDQDEPGASGFAAHLASALQQPVATLVNDGGGSTLVRQALARRSALLDHKKLVIWEFAERDIRFGIQGWRIVALAHGPLASPKTLAEK